ncbi:MAG: hypothetical protein AAF710_02790 [Planctomycetota bacterium]
MKRKVDRWRPGRRAARRHFATIGRFEKWAKDPVCLRCGYDLRGLAERGRTACPECGLGCRRRDLMRQVTRLRPHQNPVHKEVSLGLTILISIFPLVLVVGWPLGVLLSVALGGSVVGGWVFFLPTVAILVLGLSAWAASPLAAYRVFRSLTGVRLWAGAQVLTAAGAALCVVPVLWLVMVAVAAHDALSRTAGFADSLEPFGPIVVRGPIDLQLSGWPVHAIAALCVAALIGLNRFHRHAVYRPCRRRLGVLAARYLAESDAFRRAAPP